MRNIIKHHWKHTLRLNAREACDLLLVVVWKSWLGFDTNLILDFIVIPLPQWLRSSLCTGMVRSWGSKQLEGVGRWEEESCRKSAQSWMLSVVRWLIIILGMHSTFSSFLTTVLSGIVYIYILIQYQLFNIIRFFSSLLCILYVCHCNSRFPSEKQIIFFLLFR